MQYETYTAPRTGNRPMYGVYDNFGNQPVCKRDGSPYKTTDRIKADRLAMRMNEARDAASIASALIGFGATQSEAWRYAQTVYTIAAQREP